MGAHKKDRVMKRFLDFCVSARSFNIGAVVSGALLMLAIPSIFLSVWVIANGDITCDRPYI